jgi:hypothetical protein
MMFPTDFGDERLVVVFLFKEGSVLLPRHNQLVGLDVIDQPRIRVNPFSFPLVAANVFKDLESLKWEPRLSLLAKRILRSRLDLGIVQSFGRNATPRLR